jgi:glycosyltransferase involved in cell wall biosynthesis
VLQYARERNIPVILHAHELEQAAAALSAGQIALMVQYPALVIACSHGVADLFKVLGRKDHIAVCHPSLNTAVIRVNQARTGQLRKALNAGNRFVWAMSGSLTVNKNPLLFVEIANEIIQRGLSVCFVWVGGSHQSGAYWIARQQAAFYSIAHLVHWVGPQDDDYYNYLGMADGFVLTSTEESFSLVTLEAMYLKKPTVALYSKGPAEIIADGRMGVIAHSSRELIESMIAVMNGEREIDLAAAHERHLAFSALKSRTVWEQLLNEFSVQP